MLQNYHDTRKAFPPGALIEGECCDQPSKTGWSLEILPFMESPALYALLDPTLTIGHPNNQALREADAPGFACPSDSPSELLVPQSGPEAGNASGRAQRQFRTGSYRANTGRVSGPATWYLAEDLRDSSGQWMAPKEWRGPMHLTGHLGLRQESMSKIVDGTSNTLLVGENTNTTVPERRTFWAYTWGGYAMSQAWLDPRMFMADYNECQSMSGTGLHRVCMARWYSFHPNNNNFVRCDGSVGGISRDIDLEVFGALCSIAGGEVAQEL